jgi:hypothetical protein
MDKYAALAMRGTAIVVTSRRDPCGCETSRIPHFLGNRLTDGGEVIRLTRRSHFTHRNIPGTHFSWPRGRVVVKALYYKAEGRGFETR